MTVDFSPAVVWKMIHLCRKGDRTDRRKQVEHRESGNPREKCSPSAFILCLLGWGLRKRGDDCVFTADGTIKK